MCGKFHGQRTLEGYSPWDHKESDTTKRLSLFNDIDPAAAAAKWLQSCPTCSDPIDCSLPGFSIHGIFQARVLEIAIAFSALGKLELKKKKKKEGVSKRHFKYQVENYEIFVCLSGFMYISVCVFWVFFFFFNNIAELVSEF